MSPPSDPVPPEPTMKNSAHDEVDMRLTRFELTSGFILTLVLFLGVIVSLMFLLWTVHQWASQSEIHHSPPVRTTFIEAGVRGSERDFDVPSAEEVSELTSPSIQEALNAVTASANKAADSLEQRGDFSKKHSSVDHAGD